MKYVLTQDMIFQRAKIYNVMDITKINFMGYAFNDISEISKCINLESVSFSSNQITSLKYFKDMKNLKELSLANNNISDINEIRYLSSCKNLKKLWLKGNPISRYREYRQYVINYIPSLEKLDDIEVNFERQNLNINNNPLEMGRNIIRRDSYDYNIHQNNMYKMQFNSPVHEPYIQNSEIANDNFHYINNYGNYNYNNNYAYDNRIRNKRGITPKINHNQNNELYYYNQNNNIINNNYGQYGNYNLKENNYYRKVYSQEMPQNNMQNKRQIPNSAESNVRNYRRMDKTFINGQQGILDCISTLLKRLEKDELKYILKHIDDKLSQI